MNQPTIKRKKWIQISKTLGVIGLLSHFCAIMADVVPIYESRGDHYRTGVNLHETILNTSNVNPANFGLIFTLPVNGNISNQLLYVPNLTINNAIHNVIYVTTRASMVYAYDADRAGPALWIKNLNNGGIGTRSTPVIDPKTNTLYLVTQSPAPPYQFNIHALDLISGAEKFGAPKIMSGNFGALKLTDQALKQHAGLTLANNNLIIAFTAYNEDIDNTYHGWVSAYNAGNLQLVKSFSPLGMPPATGAGIWQGGRAPVVDNNGNIYLFVGNSWANAVNSNTYDGVHNFTNSLLKLDSNLNLLDWFTPSNWNTLDITDNDLSGSGPTLIPGTSLLTGGGKEGYLYIWNTNNLGKYRANDTQVVQKFKSVPNGFLFSGPIFWTRSAQRGGSVLYTLGNNSPIYAYSFNGNTFNTTPISISSATNAIGTGYNSAITLSANGDTPGTGIIWELQNNQTNPTGGASVVRAFDATNLSNELWNSTDFASDVLTGQTTYVPPIITNGKLYVTAYNSNEVAVYGLFPSTPPPNPLPDAIVTTLSYANGIFTSTVKNQGTAATPAGVVIGVKYSVDGIGKTWGSVTGPLAAGASVTIGTNGVPYAIPSGTHSITALVDDINRFKELVETNNQISQSITVGGTSPLPDVIVTKLSYANGIFTSTVMNQGTAATPAGVVVGVKYSVDGVGKTWGSVTGPLAAGASITIGTNGVPYAIPAGTHSITALVDDINRFKELVETNNQLSQSITIP